MSVCDLLENPLEFANKLVRVQGTVRARFEYFGLESEECSPDVQATIWLSFEEHDKLGEYSRGWTIERFLQAATEGKLAETVNSVEWETPISVGSVDSAHREALNAALFRSPDDEVDVILAGRFDSAAGSLLERKSDGGVAWRVGFGHLGMARSRIVLERIEVLGQAS